MFGGLFRLAVLGSPEAPRLDARFGVLLTEVRAGVEYVARLPRPLPSELIDDVARKLKELNDVAPTWARQVNDLYVWHARSWALSAADALARKDPESALAFIRMLGLRPDAKWDGHRLFALAHVLRSRRGSKDRHVRWTEIIGDPLAYFAVAVGRQAARLQRDLDDWSALHRRECAIDLVDEVNAPGERWGRRHLEEPPDLIDDARDRARKHRALANVRARWLPKEQEQIRQLLEAGYTPAEAVAAVGKGWSPFQAFQRKARNELRRESVSRKG